MKLSTLGSLSLLLCLAACGGGGGSEADTAPAPVSSNAVPPSATASTQAYTRYVGALPASEEGAPLAIGGTSAALVSDDTEPLAVQ